MRPGSMSIDVTSFVFRRAQLQKVDLRRRSCLVPLVIYTDDQRSELQSLLPKKTGAAEEFVLEVERLVAFCVSRLRTVEVDPIPPRARLKREYRKALESAKDLTKYFGNLDPAGNYYEIIDTVSWILQQTKESEDLSALSFEERQIAEVNGDLRLESLATILIERLTEDLDIVRESLEWICTHERGTPRGRPGKDLESRTIYQISLRYRHHFGRLPTCNPRSRFNVFITKAFAFAGLCQSTWFRPIRTALNQSREDIALGRVR